MINIKIQVIKNKKINMVINQNLNNQLMINKNIGNIKDIEAQAHLKVLIVMIVQKNKHATLNNKTLHSITKIQIKKYKNSIIINTNFLHINHTLSINIFPSPLTMIK